jgi:hypothetical protein
MDTSYGGGSVIGDDIAAPEIRRERLGDGGGDDSAGGAGVGGGARN